MKKKNVISITVIAMLFAVALYFVGGTYARYVSKFDGEGSVAVAKWAVQLTPGGDSMSLNLETELVQDDVVADKIAPGGKAQGKVSLALNGTEVAVDVFATVNEEKITQAINSALGGDSVSNSDIKVTAKVQAAEGASNLAGKTSGSGTKDDPFVIKLPNGGSAFDDSDIIEVSIEVTWTNDDEHSDDHTKIGKKADSLTNLKIPVTVHAVQHLKSQKYTPKS